MICLSGKNYEHSSTEAVLVATILCADKPRFAKEFLKVVLGRKGPQKGRRAEDYSASISFIGNREVGSDRRCESAHIWVGKSRPMAEVQRRDRTVIKRSSALSPFR